jgi:hypothetical protein
MMTAPRSRRGCRARSIRSAGPDPVEGTVVVRDLAKRRRRLVAVVFAAPIVVGGTVFLASNSVAPSNAGAADVTVAINTSLASATAEVADAASGYDVTMSATLTGQGLPLSGQSVSFVTGAESCSATTGSTGIASCTTNTAAQSPSFTATFAGSGPFQQSFVTGQVGS